MGGAPFRAGFIDSAITQISAAQRLMSLGRIRRAPFGGGSSLCCRVSHKEILKANASLHFRRQPPCVPPNSWCGLSSAEWQRFCVCRSRKRIERRRRARGSMIQPGEGCTFEPNAATLLIERRQGSSANVPETLQTFSVGAGVSVASMQELIFPHSGKLSRSSYTGMILRLRVSRS